MDNTSTAKADFTRDGVTLFPELLSLGNLQTLQQGFTNLKLDRPGSRQTGLPDNLLQQIQSMTELHECARQLIGKDARLVRIIAFDKTPETNWGVPWHQDRTIAVKEKTETEGYGPWSVKNGLPHVEPPVQLMNHMVTLRVHLDRCGEDNGPLEVLKGSHKLGRVPQIDVLKQSGTLQTHACLAEERDVLAMHALTIHRSAKAANPAHRRVLHLEFCAVPLPPPLQWALTSQ